MIFSFCLAGSNPPAGIKGSPAAMAGLLKNRSGRSLSSDIAGTKRANPEAKRYLTQVDRPLSTAKSGELEGFRHKNDISIHENIYMFLRTRFGASPFYGSASLTCLYKAIY
jgi:hypothetical protein